MRMRALDRWSAVSLATTAPIPVHGEPRRRPSARLLSGMAGLLEITVVDFVEARCGEMDADQFDFRGEAARDLRPPSPPGNHPPAVAPARLPPHHAAPRRAARGAVARPPPAPRP